MDPSSYGAVTFTCECHLTIALCSTIPPLLPSPAHSNLYTLPTQKHLTHRRFLYPPPFEHGKPIRSDEASRPVIALSREVSIDGRFLEPSTATPRTPEPLTEIPRVLPITDHGRYASITRAVAVLARG